MATADTEPVSIDGRRKWFEGFDPDRRPLWVLTDPSDRVQGWLSLHSFYGRPAYAATVEVSVYTDPQAQRRGIGKTLLAHALAAAPRLRIQTLLGFIFGHNRPSLALFEQAGFERWGHLPKVALLDGIERDLAILGRRIR
jgi:phosphinothricin acetyltransferase